MPTHKIKNIISTTKILLLLLWLSTGVMTTFFIGMLTFDVENLLVSQWSVNSAFTSLSCIFTYLILTLIEKSAVILKIIKKENEDGSEEEKRI